MYFRNIFLLLLTALLAGCAASSVQRDFSLNSKPDQGIVIVSVSFDQSGSRNLQGIFYMDRGADPLRPGGVPLQALRENPFARFGSEFEGSYGQVLALALPAGKHVINSWRVYSSLYEIDPKMAPAPLEFQVVAGKVQYLGNLHLNLRSGNVFGISMINDARPEVRDQRVRDIAMIEKKYPQFKDQVSIQLLPQGSWQSDGGTRSNSPPVSNQGTTPSVIPAMPISSNKEE